MDLKLINNSNLKFVPFIQLDHITSHSNEYINTGVLPTGNIKLEMEFSFNSVSGCPYGTQTSSYNVQSFQLVPYGGSLYYMMTLGQGTTTHPTLYTNKRYHVEHKYGIQKLYDTADSSTLLINETNGSGAFSSSKSIYLFAKNSNSGVSSKSSINLYWCKIYNGDTLIRDYVPSYDNYKYCLFDKVTKEYYHNIGGSNFTVDTTLGGSGLSQKITTLFVKDCLETDCLDVLRRITIAQTGIQTKLTRVRCDIGNVSGTLEELQNYTTLNGFNDDYEPQVKPRLVGTWTINSYHSNEERNAIDIDGLTVLSDDNYNAEYLLANDMLAVQTLDSTAPNYNPAAAIILQNAGYGRTLDGPIVEGETGRWFLPKAVASIITSISTIFRNGVDIVDANGIVSDDTTLEYSFTSFEELQYTRITSIAAGSSTSALGGFGGCTALESINIPNTITTIGAYAFYDCTNLEDIIIPNTVTSIGSYTFYNCVKLKDLTIPCNISTTAFRGTTTSSNNYHVGDTTGNLIIKGNLTAGSNYSTHLDFANIIIHGTGRNDTGGGFYGVGTFRVKGIYSIYGNGGSVRSQRPFVEFMSNVNYIGSATNSKLFDNNTKGVVHFGNTSLVTVSTTSCNMSYVTKLYVGNGSSRSNDEAVLALYLADTNWSAQSAKLATWYDYNGTYKWYYITDNLTNCTNTNPDEWPHITRGDSYETTIVPDEGLTLDSVTVEMLDTDTTSSTYDTMVDITSSVYDSSTGEINIPSVTGNVVITASAS